MQCLQMASESFDETAVETAINYAAEAVEIASLKLQQRDAVRTFVLGRDVFVCLPTGYGKSFCYLRGCSNISIVLCISPLTALMMEQRSKFCVRGIRSEFQLHQDIKSLCDVQKGKSLAEALLHTWKDSTFSLASS